MNALEASFGHELEFYGLIPDAAFVSSEHRWRNKTCMAALRLYMLSDLQQRERSCMHLCPRAADRAQPRSAPLSCMQPANVPFTPEVRRHLNASRALKYLAQLVPNLSAG